MSKRPSSTASHSGLGRTPVWVVKVGGKLCEEPALRARFAGACAALAAPLVVIHGGGAQVTRLQQALGMKPRFSGGRRMTAPGDLAAVEMALTGDVNPSLVRALAAAGRPAVGLSGCDAGLLRCRLLPGLGRVGTPVEVDVRLMRVLLSAGYTPVISPLSLGPGGEVVNVNADEAACALAGALGAQRLLLLSDVSGVRVREELKRDIAAGSVEVLVQSGEIKDGMIPKLRAAAAALARGVSEVRIAGFSGSDLAAVEGTIIHPASGRPALPVATAPPEGGKGSHV